MNPPKLFETKIIVSPEDFSPTREDFEVIGAFNPGVTTVETPQGLETILFVRVAETPLESMPGKILLPYFHIPNVEQAPPKIAYDIVDRKTLKRIRKREVTPKQGPIRLRHISLPRMVILNTDREISNIHQEPAISPSWEFDRFGLEDVRITYLENRGYIITYATPHREFGVWSSILINNEIKNPLSLERITLENTPRPEIRGKDVALFPTKIPSPTKTETIDKRQPIYASFIRPNAFSDLSIPGIWISYSPDLVHWGQDHRLITSEMGEVTGTGSPPVKRPKGWVAAYHETTRNEKGKTKYVTRLMTLDLEEPWKVLHKSPVFLDREDFRKRLPKDGYVPDTVFTTGMVVDGDRTDFYQGIDDQWTTCASFHTDDIDKFARTK
ncbi:MAG: hypothetical protein ABIJ20_00445 [Nanoarchaeota archaeon]|nr:hypothetical protein [Nanoarchaeota archaeon]MBU1445376.1 hypothetical protein [Nanoarchaeota archaeon]MBU2406742.1 hypothetical protein [Nanoarchaeota archaeon]MBU2420149.1 hypothetical protein [Nanoarchaeota archaeon]MBU2475276.1 hypothetical protein [Nanoarchaeota archaeon]